MSERYYYLLDGKEHGPFTRFAVERLMGKGELEHALFRTATNAAWQTAQELDLASTTLSSPSSHSEVSPPTSESIVKAIALGIFVLLLIAIGIALFRNQAAIANKTIDERHQSSNERIDSSLGKPPARLEDIKTGTWKTSPNNYFIRNGKISVGPRYEREVNNNGSVLTSKQELPPGSTDTPDDGSYMPLMSSEWEGDSCLSNKISTHIEVNNEYAVIHTYNDKIMGVCLASRDFEADYFGKIYQIKSGQLYKLVQNNSYGFTYSPYGSSRTPLKHYIDAVPVSPIKYESTVKTQGTFTYTPRNRKLCLESSILDPSMKDPVPLVICFIKYRTIEDVLQSGKLDDRDENCTYKAKSTLWMLDKAMSRTTKFTEADISEIESVSPFVPTDEACQKRADQASSQPELAPLGSPEPVKSTSTADTESGRLLTDSYYRFKDASEVLSMIRGKESPDWNARSLTGCLCAISGNIVELSASDKIVLYNDPNSSSVVAYSWEDNHGNPHTHFYRYDGSWVDVGKEIMPNYPGEPGRYFKANPEGVTVYRGGDLELLKYAYSDGKFVRRFK